MSSDQDATVATRVLAWFSAPSLLITSVLYHESHHIGVLAWWFGNQWPIVLSAALLWTTFIAGAIVIGGTLLARASWLMPPIRAIHAAENTALAMAWWVMFAATVVVSTPIIVVHGHAIVLAIENINRGVAVLLAIVSMAVIERGGVEVYTRLQLHGEVDKETRRALRLVCEAPPQAPADPALKRALEDAATVVHRRRQRAAVQLWLLPCIPVFFLCLPLVLERTPLPTWFLAPFVGTNASVVVAGSAIAAVGLAVDGLRRLWKLETAEAEVQSYLDAVKRSGAAG